MLNVWTPALGDGRRRPVMVWWHGGAFERGSGAGPSSDGATLALRNDVVVVTVNHRLNVFGHLYLGDWFGEEYATSGNAGMLDLIESLRWVHDNIPAFGGDPGNVTVFGVSGGGAKICTSLAMPAARGLFHRGIVQSGHDLWKRVTLEAATRASHAVLAELGVKRGDAAKLAAASTEDLLQALAVAGLKSKPDPSAGLPGWVNYDLLAPVIDGIALPDYPISAVAAGSAPNISVIIGTAQHDHFSSQAERRGSGERGAAGDDFGRMDEAGLRRRLRTYLGDRADGMVDLYRRTRPGASPSALVATILADGDWRIPAVRLAEAKLRGGGAPPFMYFYVPEFPGAPTQLAFDNLHVPPVSWSVIRALGGQVSQTWVSFARGGDPNNPTIPAWPPYSLEDRATMVLDYQCRVEHDPWREERLAWAGIR